MEKAAPLRRGLQDHHGLLLTLRCAPGRLVHRDIKPDNILCSPMGTAKLVDFGLVKDVHFDEGALTQTGVVAGTPLYMSPEQSQRWRGSIAAVTFIRSVRRFTRCPDGQAAVRPPG